MTRHSNQPGQANAVIRVAITLMAVVALVFGALFIVNAVPAQGQESEGAEVTTTSTTAVATDELQELPEEAAEEPAVSSQPEGELVEAESNAEVPNTEDAVVGDEEIAPADDLVEDESSEDVVSAGESSGEPSEEEQPRFRFRRALTDTTYDPRYQCGVDITLIVDTTVSTEQYKAQTIEAAKRVVTNLAGSGAHLSLITFNRVATVRLANQSLDPAGVKTANNVINGLGTAWAAGGSNYPDAFDKARQLNSKAVIVIGDAIPKLNREIRRTAYPTTQEFITQTLDAAQQLRDSGANIFSIDVKNADERVMNGRQGITSLKQENYPDSEPLVEPVTRNEDNLFRDANGQLEPIKYKPCETQSTEKCVKGTPGNRRYFERQGKYKSGFEVWTERRVKGRDIFNMYSDVVLPASSDYSDIVEKVSSLSDGCWGTVNIEKKIVDGSGRVLRNGEGYQFVADRALEGSDVRSNYTQATNDQGQVTFYYPTSPNGTSQITLTETPQNGYEIRRQQASGQSVVATCTAASNDGQTRSVSYGRGNQIVVRSNDNNSFTISGVRKQDRLTCVVHNTQKAKPQINLNKTVKRGFENVVINGQQGQRFSIEYAVTAQNTSEGVGKPNDIREEPSAPRGASVVGVVAKPDGNKSVVNREIALSNNRGVWTLRSADMETLAANETRRMTVVVTYQVNNPGQLNDNSLTCADGQRGRGFYNAISITNEGDRRSEANACANGVRPGFEVKKFINNIDADTQDAAASMLPGGDSYTITYEFRNTGQVAIKRVLLDDFELRNRDGQPTNRKMVPRNLQCRGPIVGEENGSTSVTFRRTLRPGQKTSCSWTVSRADNASYIPREGQYHGDQVVANAIVDANGTEASVQSTDNAWIFALPVATGNLPNAGGRGTTPWIIGGLMVMAVGAYIGRKRRA